MSPGRVAVLGLGVMGGSLVRALSAAAREGRVTLDGLVGWSPDERERALAAETCDLETAESALSAVRGAAVVVLAAPLDATCALVGDLRHELAEDATLTDVASLKAPVRDAVDAAGLSHRWVGSHPMAGREASGFGASRADLFRDALVWLTPHRAGAAHRRRTEALWEAVGAHTRIVDPGEHDTLMARVSHLPQLVSNALAATLADAGVPAGALGPGGRDMTRLAASSPVIWRDILAAAPPELASELDALARYLHDAARSLEEGDVDALVRLMERTRRWRGDA